MMRACLEQPCSRPATAKGRCDFHRRKYERERSAKREAATTGGPYRDIVAARDADPEYRYPTRRADEDRA
jgi:hypothetical protein